MFSVARSLDFWEFHTPRIPAIMITGGISEDRLVGGDPSVLAR